MADCKYCTGVSYVFVEFPVINSSCIRCCIYTLSQSLCLKLYIGQAGVHLMHLDK